MAGSIDAPRLIDRLSHGARAICALVADLSLEDMRFVPPHGAWSIAEILGHLVDEEVEDFRVRLQLTLESPGTEWPRTDPEAKVRERGYRDADPKIAMASFVRERDASVAWLRSLANPDWSTAYVHPRVGPVPAGLLLASWAAHDALHIRQIAKRLYELSARDAGPYPIDYAGEWKA